MTDNRVSAYLSQMNEAAFLAQSYIEEMSKDAFLADKRTQQAVILNIILIGEAAARLLKDPGNFVLNHPEIPWNAMKGMRNRIAHGYSHTDLDIVWDTVKSAIPELAAKLQAAISETGFNDIQT